MKLKILILDDSEVVLEMTALALTQAGYEVFPATSLFEFDQILKNHNPDVILTDIQMPETTGDNICKILKQKLHTKLIPVVLFSTIPENELAEIAERVDADGYVCKGCGVDEIVNKIRSLTEEILF
jgi:CheY-like chemotaxis protein